MKVILVMEIRKTQSFSINFQVFFSALSFTREWNILIFKKFTMNIDWSESVKPYNIYETCYIISFSRVPFKSSSEERRIKLRLKLNMCWSLPIPSPLLSEVHRTFILSTQNTVIFTPVRLVVTALHCHTDVFGSAATYVLLLNNI